MSLKLGLRNRIRRGRAGGFTGLLDQSFATGAKAAYSLRRLKSSATKAVRVREDSGNTETDIGFTGGLLDETALLNHVGSNNGFVTKWYDQSGNGNDASNSTASEQPQIVSGGSVIKENGKPAIELDGSDDILIVNNTIKSTFSDYSFFIVQNKSDGATFGADATRLDIDRKQDSTSYRYFDNSKLIGTNAPLNQQNILEVHLESPSGAESYVNNAQSFSGKSYQQRKIDGNIFIGDVAPRGIIMKGKLQELTIFDEVKKNERSKIYSNINNYIN